MTLSSSSQRLFPTAYLLWVLGSAGCILEIPDPDEGIFPCSGPGDCAKGFECQSVRDENGTEGSVCVKQGENGPGSNGGQSCDDDNQCPDGPCLDGICCGGTCDGHCVSCLGSLTGQPDGQCHALKAY